MNRSTTAVQVMRGLLNGGNTEVITRHVDLDLVSHFRGRRESFDRYRRWLDLHRPTPMLYTPYRWAESDDMVAVHALYRWDALHRPSDGPGFVAVDFFRFVRERIVEHWNVEQPSVLSTTSCRGIIEGEGAFAGQNQADVEVVDAFLSEVVAQGDADLIPRFVAHDLKQHRGDLADGSEALAEWTRLVGPIRCDIVHLVGEGPLVMVLSDHLDGPLTGRRVAEVFRLAGRRIVEQWRVVEHSPVLAGGGTRPW